jgi:hypothetical protein
VGLHRIMRDLALASARRSESDLRDHLFAVSAHLADPSTRLIGKLVIRAGGRERFERGPQSERAPRVRETARLNLASTSLGASAVALVGMRMRWLIRPSSQKPLKHRLRAAHGTRELNVK